MTATTCTNGKPQRKQLADQLDRLDTIIDTLAEGLNQAVADACREGTRLAVKDVLIEVMSNPELRALIAPQAAPAASSATPLEPKQPGLWNRIKSKLGAVTSAAVTFATKVKTAVAAKCATVTTTVAAVGAATGETVSVRRVLGVALGIGLLVGVACHLLPESASAVVAGIGAAATTAFAQTGAWLRRAGRRIGLLN